MSPSVFTILSQACSKGIGDGLSCSQMLSKSLMKFYPVSGCPEFTSLQRAVQRRRAFYFLPTEQHIIGTRTIVKSSSSFVMSGSNSSNEDETKTDDHLSVKQNIYIYIYIFCEMKEISFERGHPPIPETQKSRP